MIRPGPPSIDAGTAPGGIVVHVYGIPSGELVHAEASASLATVAHEAGLAAERTVAHLEASGDDGLVLVFYDGDTGARLLPPGTATGDQLDAATLERLAAELS